MAVVSISRIQVRRGRRTDLPQLASGEFGWAVDSQEIFIGNGAVSEGAPYVGNTKLITDRDNLFQLAGQYTYKQGTTIQTGSTFNSPVERSLQDRLDDIVTLASFGGTGDGTDHTAILQRAIDQLFLGPSTKNTEKSRVTLIIEPGIYTLSNTIHIPPFANIVGAGIDKTIFRSTPGHTKEMFLTVGSDSIPGLYAFRNTTTSLNQSRNILFQGATIESVNEQKSFVVDCVKDSIFRDLKFVGSFDLLTSTRNIGDMTIEVKALSQAVSTSECLFENITFRNKCVGLVIDDDVIDNTFTNCKFDELFQGCRLGHSTVLGSPGQNYGPRHITIEKSTFDQIQNEGITVMIGNDILSRSNKFFSVGNNAGSPANPSAAVITYTTRNNQSIDDWFQRTDDLGYNATYSTIPYYPEVAANSMVSLDYTKTIDIEEYSTPTKKIGFAADRAKKIEVDYVYKSETIVATRIGTLEIIINPANQLAQISDTYDFIGANPDDAERLEFSVVLSDYDSNNILDTLDLLVLNLTSNDNAKLDYKVKIKS